MNPKNINVNFNGKEYLEYLKYKDSKPKVTFDKKFTPIYLFMVIIVFGIVGLSIWIDSLTPVEPIQITTKGILAFLAICGGIGWIIHGTGFLLVRR